MKRIMKLSSMPLPISSAIFLDVLMSPANRLLPNGLHYRFGQTKSLLLPDQVVERYPLLSQGWRYWLWNLGLVWSSSISFEIKTTKSGKTIWLLKVGPCMHTCLLDWSNIVCWPRFLTRLLEKTKPYAYLEIRYVTFLGPEMAMECWADLSLTLHIDL